MVPLTSLEPVRCDTNCANTPRDVMQAKVSPRGQNIPVCVPLDLSGV